MKRHLDQHARNLARLEQAQKRAEARLRTQHNRLNRRFDHMREQINKRYNQPSDTQQRIIQTALDLLDQVGYNDLSLRKLASSLDMQASAIYWHFENKEVLIDYMAEAIMQTEFKGLEVRPDDMPWQDWVVDICQKLRRAMHSRRDGGRIVAGAHPYPAVTLLRLFEITLESLISAGLDRKTTDLIATSALHLTFGRVIEEQSSPEPHEIETNHLELIEQEFPYVSDMISRKIANSKKGYDEFEDCIRLIVGYA